MAREAVEGRGQPHRPTRHPLCRSYNNSRRNTIGGERGGGIDTVTAHGPIAVAALSTAAAASSALLDPRRR